MTGASPSPSDPAALAVLRSGALSLEALSPSREWTMRNAALGGRARAFAARFADAHGGPRIAQTPVPDGVEWMASGFVSGERPRAVIEGTGCQVEVAVDADDDGTLARCSAGWRPPASAASRRRRPAAA